MSKILGRCFTKTCFSTFGKWKIDFLFKEDENSLWRHCLPLQDTHMSIIWDHYHRLFVGYGHNQAHFTKKNIVFVLEKSWENYGGTDPVQISCWLTWSSSCFGTMRKCHSKIHSYAKCRIYMHGTILNLHHNMKYNYKRGHTMVLIPIRHGSDTNKNTTSTKSSWLTTRHMHID